MEVKRAGTESEWPRQEIAEYGAVVTVKYKKSLSNQTNESCDRASYIESLSPFKLAPL